MRPARVDYEYEHHGVRNLFLWVEPLAGRRHVAVTEQRTKQDWARFIRELVAVHYPETERVVLVLGLHDAPLHGSWLNVAEIDLSILARRCLGRRIPDADTLATEVAAREAPRNARRATIDQRFTTADARTKLTRLYPSR